ncbi:glycosyltransferase family 2 protein [Lentisphaerota bacterium ZTH]|nr:glycosyltransferase [Lentisphaerota bacterium]WET05748.1 glycosyltransferase family 2 protein [Lentisphaerota bacterium ZTH]
MKISVITAVYNGEDYIRETVESVLNQKGDFELEYIICDGKSTDRTLEILEEYRECCRIYSNKDKSPQDAINKGMNLATGDIACWLNADDVFEPGSLQKVAAAFNKHPDLQWLYGKCHIINDQKEIIRRPVTFYKNLIGIFYSYNLLLCENYINQPATFWRLDLWHKAKKLNPSYKAAWDYELWLRMAEMARPLHLRKYLSSFRRHDNSISEKYFEKQFAEELEIAKKHGSWWHVLIHKFNTWKTVTVYKLIS